MLHILGITAVLVALPARTAAETPLPAPVACRDEGEKNASPPPGAAERIEEATGLRFSVFQSYLRRNLIRTRTPYGFRIRQVTPGSPAARIGLQPGDVLLTWDGRPIRRLRALAEWIDAVDDGARVKITYARKKKKRWLGSRRPWETRSGEITPRKES